MNAGSFLKYIKTPSLLHQLSYEELKTIVLQYPYSANLHLLLLLKSKLESHKDYDKNLAMAAAYSIDRAYLFRLLQNPELQSLQASQVLKEDDVLELKDLSRLEEDLEKEVVLLTDEAIPGEAPSLEMEIPVQSSETKKEPESEESVLDLPQDALEEKPLTSETHKPHQNSDDLLSTMNALNAIIEDVIDHEAKSEGISTDEIQEISDLTETLKTFLPKEDESKLEPKEIVPEEDEEKPESAGNIQETLPVEKGSEILEEKQEEPVEEAEKEDRPKVKKKTTQKKVTEIASKSIKSQSRVASETLAQILEKQGLTDKAIQMYEQLILTFPEKSAYFAAKIENLKNL